MEVETATLYQLLARHWTVGASVTNAVFDNAGNVVGFALSDGGLAISRLADAEPPQSRCRMGLDDGRTTILPRQKPVPPLTKITIGNTPFKCSAFGKSGFVAGDCGRLLQVSASGTTNVVLDHVSQVDLIAPVGTGGFLAASGGAVISYDPDGEVMWLQQRAGNSASALSVSSDGRRFAIGVDSCLLIRTVGPRPDPIASFELGTIAKISWSPDGNWVAVSLTAAGVVLVRPSDGRTIRIPGYPGVATSMSWTSDSRMLATSGAYRTIVWDVSTIHGESERPRVLATGRAGFVLVEAVDVHPERPLVAAGYGDGRVVVAKIGTPDELIVKPPGRGAIRALQWSQDGQHLALGTGDGEAAVVTFPSHIFK